MDAERFDTLTRRVASRRGDVGWWDRPRRVCHAVAAHRCPALDSGRDRLHG